MTPGDRVQLRDEALSYGTVLRTDEEAVSVKLDDGRAVAVAREDLLLL
ncbi:putative protein OS=Tsukamurella paurometabola (strain ATCC 8368 / DSM / CCUG 35730 /CIP 100753 / JCM 10117 / KCTC 9821 / NBRC 16120 / NCIMB 702349/ NCTC 13040) OX=521096 GN=Tpau_0047 PE=4 SV=1 [Tsukamurella paurometabola]|uniref:Uncharacterized protein n=1 Tax=Tsukamurella paurometabola (strain ATCC 8368 / DSM 20162 / CCUG 35730 / CIP 100753 / JCM 10117 / KCTC 9821 / NBRC 16120 / NCIMB 702349 / NCTC 13040) TaxID=521096 RepID=D5UPT3_TSUPD|nr:hypothetical protein [Tsukamurella paurometabola]ADG76701.1 hypothetical protein Tpau_0047 [Tsukamurella paurometabola DSM 20162]SUP41279.1 Uncharacterised protein [Tsukamurella paurometabola]